MIARNLVQSVFSLVLAAGLTACANAVVTPKVQANNKQITSSGHSKKIKVFLLAGQSNMDGRGDGSKLTHEDKTRLAQTRKRVKFAYNHFPVAPLYVTESSRLVKRKFKLDTVFGPELFFGIGMAEAYPEDEFLFIKRSLGGQSLYGSWNPNWNEDKARAMHELKRPKLYSDMIAYTRGTLAALHKNSYKICAVLWVQGEADSSTKKHGTIPAEEYHENLTNLINRFRRDLGDQNLPFVMFQVGKGKVVKAMQYADRNMKNVTLIPQSKDKRSSDYYPTYGPPTGHYTYASMKRIGEAFVKAYRAEYQCD